MLLKLTHTTDLSYTGLISESVMELRVAPRQEPDQHRLSFTLQIGPPTSVNSYFDWLGNTVHAFSINAFHKEIRIVANSVVETDRALGDPTALADTWPIDASSSYAMWDYLQLPRDGAASPIVDTPALRDVVKNLGASDGMKLGELAMDVLRLIADQFEYEKGITTAASPITEILAHRKGVCQDFTHLMIGMARALRIPARYVSGLVHPEAQKFRGYTQTHAWVELFFPSTGWIGFDPTNKCVIGPNFVKVAVGRHYSDVAPNKGLFRGKAKESINVTVQSDELKSLPLAMAAERFEPLPIATYQESQTPPPLLATQQQEHSQQQQQQQQ